MYRLLDQPELPGFRSKFEWTKRRTGQERPAPDWADGTLKETFHFANGFFHTMASSRSQAVASVSGPSRHCTGRRRRRGTTKRVGGPLGSKVNERPVVMETGENREQLEHARPPSPPSATNGSEIAIARGYKLKCTTLRISTLYFNMKSEPILTLRNGSGRKAASTL